ncbi:DoxX family protein [Kangiella marina]|uniref:DoxX family protein n=1 Tax=Kangiella marina TaxID=1079178 RepID=A0ABP8IKS2_9GAMM
MKTKVLTVVLAIIFLVSGGAKLLGLEFELEAFSRWGYPLWFMYLTGVIEVVGGVALLVPRLASYAAVGLSVVMVGAVATHLINSEWVMLVIASVILALLLWRSYIGKAEIVKVIRAITGSSAAT